jgi:hypothetical protein
VPVLTIFAGPNGSGKSSLIRQVEFEGRENLLEADAILRYQVESKAHQAGASATSRHLSRKGSSWQGCGVRSKQGELCDQNHPGRKLDELCDKSSAGLTVFYQTLLYLPG